MDGAGKHAFPRSDDDGNLDNVKKADNEFKTGKSCGKRPAADCNMKTGKEDRC